MAELYDWSKESKGPVLTVTKKSIIVGEEDLDVKRVEIPGRKNDVLIVKGFTNDRKFKQLKNKTTSPSKKFNLVGSITDALNRALNRLNPNRTILINGSIMVSPDSDGRLYFEINGLKFFLGKDKISCMDELGFLWMLEAETSRLYGGTEEAIDFDFTFVTPELEDEYYNKLEDKEFGCDPFIELFKSKSPTTSGKVVDFAAYKEQFGDRPHGR